MRTLVVTTFAILAPAVLSAGQVYGTIVSEGKGIKEVAVEIKCGSNEAVTGKTAADGAYRLNVPQQGQCTLTLPSYEGKPSAMVFSTSNPAVYNFELSKGSDGRPRIPRSTTSSCPRDRTASSS
jgi:hypothetical protein